MRNIAEKLKNIAEKLRNIAEKLKNIAKKLTFSSFEKIAQNIPNLLGQPVIAGGHYFLLSLLRTIKCFRSFEHAALP